MNITGSLSPKRSSANDSIVPCPDCNLPAGRIVNGELIFTTRHHGERHEIRITLESLRFLLTSTAKTVLSSARATVPP